MSIIIVGNGTSILDNDNGNKIDSFDTVVRFNSFKTKGYEKHTGTKTNIWMTVNRAHKEDIDSFGRVIVHSWGFNKNTDKLYKDLSSLRICEKTERDFVKSIPLRDPSTGLIAIWMFIEEYDQVCITGFDWWDREKHHYGDNEIRGTLHKPDKEFEIIKGLEEEQKIYFL